MKFTVLAYLTAQLRLSFVLSFTGLIRVNCAAESASLNFPRHRRVKFMNLANLTAQLSLNFPRLRRVNFTNLAYLTAQLKTEFRTEF